MDQKLLPDNYYEIFGLMQSFVIDMSELQTKMRELQQKYHPDNFANDPANLTQSLMLSSQINHAYQTLSKPLDRAIYLLKLNNVIVDLVYDTKFSHEFLFMQIELREEIDAAKEQHDFNALEQIESKLKLTAQQRENDIMTCFNHKDFVTVVELVKELSFYAKLIQLVDEILINL